MKAKLYQEGIIKFVCPGCNEEHLVWIDHPNYSGAKWSFNGDFEKPTFSPSILLRTGLYVDPNWKPDQELEDYHHSNICHSFVTDGKISFCGDSTHHLSGQQNIELPDIT